MSLLVLFSGACNSGKTTTLKAVAEKLTARGLNVIILSELIRNATDKPIDELRKNAKEYLQLQNSIIREKIKQECLAINDSSDTIYLADRAATDSMFYLENYVEKSQLGEKELELFSNLHSEIHKHLIYNFKRYSLVVNFSPITNIERDKYRPNNIKALQQYEYLCIFRLNTFYHNIFPVSNCMIEANNCILSQANVVSIITDKIIKMYYEKANVF